VDHQSAVGRFVLAESYREFATAFSSSKPLKRKYSQNDMCVMVSKLSHIKRCAAKREPQLDQFTQQVGDSSARAHSLAELLANDQTKSFQAADRRSTDRGATVRLGSVTEDKSPISGLLWKMARPDKIRGCVFTLCARSEHQIFSAAGELRSSNTLVWVKRRSCTHGDLNATNVAIEATAERYHAYIIDALECRRILRSRFCHA